MSKAYKLISPNDPRLKMKSDPFDFDNPEHLEALYEAEKILLFSKNGCGIALPQIGVNIRAFIIRWAGQKTYVINPFIIKKGGRVLGDREGCLTYPNKTRVMKRYTEIQATYQNVDKTPVTRVLTGMEARIYQHEYDHCEGKTIW